MGFGFKNILRGLRLIPVSSTAISQKGDIEVLDSSGKLNYFNGSTASPMVTESHSAVLTNKTIDADLNTLSNIDNADIKAGAGIVYSKLNLSNSIVDADINAAAAILYSKLNLTGGIVNADVNAAAAIVYSKLNLTASIVNADIANAAAIARSKMAAGSANHVIINDGSGNFSSEATLAKSRGGSGQDNSSVTFPASGVLVTEAGTQTLSNKSFSDALVTAEVSTPATPSSGFGKIYFKSDGKAYTLNDSGTESELLTSSNSEPRGNFLLNSNFDIWQRGTSFTGTTNPAFLADRWFVYRSGDSVAISRVSGTSDGAKYGISFSNNSLAGGSIVTMGQTLENLDSIKLYNKTVSLSCKVKALGNINQATLYLNYATTEQRTTFSVNVLGSQSAAINSASFTTITLNNVSVGTLMTLNGSLTVNIRPTAVSSGNIGDSGNGLIVEQVMLNIGSTVAEYQPQFKSFAEELSACQRYYEKSYDYSVVPGTASSEPGLIGGIAQATQILNVNAVFKVQKRITPVQTTNWLNYAYDGNVNGISNYNGTGSIGTTATALKLSDKQITGISTNTASLSVGAHYWFHWVCDCEI